MGPLSGALVLSSCALAPPAPRFETEIDEARYLQAQTEGLRGRTVGSPVPVRCLPPEEFRAFLSQAFRRDNPPGSLRGLARSLEAFGLAPPGLDFEREILEAIEEGIAGVYDPPSKSLLLREDLAGGGAGELTLVHELAHAIDDASFGLARYRSGRLDDGAAAAGALIEGSATEAMLDHLAALRSGLFRDSVGHPLSDVAVALFAARSERLARLLPESAGASGPGRAPAALRVALLFPYAHGLRFVHELRSRYGTGMVERAFADPPKTSEQVLHPEKYHERREDPVEVALAPLAEGAGKEVAAGKMGEFGIYLVLAERLGPDRAREGARGWGGDSYRVLEEEGRALSLLWHTEWDRPLDARQFERTLAEAWGRRFGAPILRDGSSFVVRRPDGLVARIERVGRRVLLADGFLPAEARRRTEGMARGDETRRPVPPPPPSVLSGAASPLRPLFDVERFDHSTRASLLRGLLCRLETLEGGFEFSLIGGGAARARSDRDRLALSTLFGFLGVERNRRAAMTSFQAWPILQVGFGLGGHAVGLAGGLLGEASGPGGTLVRTGLLDYQTRRTLAFGPEGRPDVVRKVERRVSLLFGLLGFDLP
ncbi:MAG TPA: hypothetical protein VFI25_19950 [Planctomycetota bacterium]|nr:hypothetical protein [Planctomycetota bacterium]